MKLGLGLRVGNALALTPQLQQAIRLLQLSTHELEIEIQSQLEANPLLEVPEEEVNVSGFEDIDEASYETDFSPPDFSNTDFEEPDYQEQVFNEQNFQEQNALGVLPVEAQWDDIYSTSPVSASQHDHADIPIAHQVSLKEQLQQQARMAHFSPLDYFIATTFIDDIDARGYLSSSLESLCEVIQLQVDEVVKAHQNNISQDTLEWTQIDLQQIYAVFHALQNFEPAGVFARNLIECLQLQVKQAQAPHKLKQAALAVLEHSNYLLNHEKIKLLKATELSLDDLNAALSFIRSFTPDPGAKFGRDDEVYQTPDVVVMQQNNRWQVILNTDRLPKLRINQEYASMIKRADDSSSNQFLRHHLIEAKNFIKGIEERHKTLLKVATCIIKHQQDFLTLGPEYMKPLVLREVAEEVELHESTVSRVTSQKFILTPQGLFELKYFFSSHVGTSAGGACSSTAIRAKIKKLIKEENPKKPLSDQALSVILSKEGIEVARRTVAKYRESLNIPASSDRKCLL